MSQSAGCVSRPTPAPISCGEAMLRHSSATSEGRGNHRNIWRGGLSMESPLLLRRGRESIQSVHEP